MKVCNILFDTICVIGVIIYFSATSAANGEEQPQDIILDDTVLVDVTQRIDRYCARGRCLEVDASALNTTNILRFRIGRARRFSEIRIPGSLIMPNIEIRYSQAKQEFSARVVHGEINHRCRNNFYGRNVIFIDLHRRPALEERQFQNCDFADL